MSVVKTMTSCPFCKEPIAAGATKCKHCQSDLTAAAKKKRPYFAKFNTFRTGFLSGILFTLAIGILFYIQFYQ